MKASLAVIFGAKPATIKLRLPTLVGRSHEASVRVSASLVSRHHCELFEQNDRLMVRDLNSSNGTFLNDQRIEEPTALTTQDQLTIGEIIFEVNCGESAPATPASEVPDLDPMSATSATPGQIESAILHYSESSEGSFIGVENIDPQETDEQRLDIGDSEPRSVNSDDSALRSFLNNLE